MGELNLGDVQNLSQVLERTPCGVDMERLAKSLGLVGTGNTGARRGFVTDVSTMSPPKLSSEQSYWASEFGRVVEMIGLLQGQEKLLGLQAKAVRARERSRIRREQEQAGEKSTAGAISDMAEEAAGVIELEERIALLSVVMSSAMASKEAITVYLTALSREISFRSAQMAAGIYG